jgi:hypothetical protein
MKITSVSASFGFTKNLGNYQTLRADATVTAEVETGESAEEVFSKIFQEAKNQVKTQVEGGVANR